MNLIDKFARWLDGTSQTFSIKAVDDERKRYKQALSGEKVNKPKEGLTVERVGFGHMTKID
jgi:hypothetical protein